MYNRNFHKQNIPYFTKLKKSLHISNVYQVLRGGINIITTAVLEVVQGTIVDP